MFCMTEPATSRGLFRQISDTPSAVDSESVSRLCDALPRAAQMFFLHLLTFNDDPDPRVDSESPFHFIRHCAIGDFWTFVSIFHTINGRFVPYLAKWLTPKRLHPQHFGTDLTDIRIRINPKIWIQITSVILSFCKDDNWRTRKRSSTKHGRFSAFC